MKKTICVAICLLMSCVTMAQTQQGYVKTKGRMVNGQLVPGKGIQNALVAIRGRSTVLSQANGSFSFSMPALTFNLDSVSKKGYQLVDADALSKPYKYSANPLYLVMDTPEQQQADLLAKERRLRRDLQRRLQEREDEVEDLNVSLEEKNRMLEEINKEREDNEKIIKELSEYYAALDYDQLDDFQRTVTDLLENGQLERADSMLRSRGDMQSRVREINREQEAEAKEETELNQRQKDLTASKKGTQKKIELVAADCYNFYQRFLQVHQNDSAAHYLELRAQIDTTNLKWQSEAGQFIREYLADYPKALLCFQRVLRQSIEQDGEESEWAAQAYHDIGSVFDYQANFSQALEHYNKAMDIRMKVLGQEHPVIVESYISLGSIYREIAEYSKALEYFNKALTIREKVLGAEDSYGATLYNSIGLVYFTQEDYSKALEYYEQGLAICEKIYGPDHPDVATSYNNIAQVYSNKGDDSKALEYLIKALSIYEKTFGSVHPYIALSYNNIGYVYTFMGDYSKALEFLGKSLTLSKRLFGPEHPSVAGAYNNIASIYCDQGDYSKALECYEKTLSILEKVYGMEDPTTKYTLNEINVVKYQQAMSSGNLSDFLSEHAFTASVKDGDTPAGQQGMSGEYYLLEYADWKQDSSVSIYDKKDELKGKPKDILVLKDGIVSQHHFENAIGVQFGIKEVSKEERLRINKAYEDWKKQNRK